jgi:hypothetical protein
MWRSGGNTRLLRKRSSVRFPHSVSICVHEHVCLYWVWVFLCICMSSSSSSSPYPTMWGRHNMFSSSVLFYHSSSPCSRLLFMSSFTQSIHLFLGRPLLGCPSTFIVIHHSCIICMYLQKIKYISKCLLWTR